MQLNSGLQVAYWLKVVSMAASNYTQVVGDGVSDSQYYMRQYLHRDTDYSFCIRPHFSPINGGGDPDTCVRDSFGGRITMRTGQTYFVVVTWDAKGRANNGRDYGIVTTYVNSPSFSYAYVQYNRTLASGGTPNNTNLNFYIGYDDVQPAWELGEPLCF